MDFLVLFLFYLAFILMSVVIICICAKTQRLKGLVLGGAQMCSRVFPQCLQRAVPRFLHHLFHTRNHTFIALHLILQGLVYAEYTWEVFGYCQELEFSLHYLLLPYVLLTVNLVFFTLTCLANPGTITKANELLLLQVYEFDEVMFPKNARCFTCNLRKPARSKHCSECGSPVASPVYTQALSTRRWQRKPHTRALCRHSSKFPSPARSTETFPFIHLY